MDAFKDACIHKTVICTLTAEIRVGVGGPREAPQAGPPRAST